MAWDQEATNVTIKAIGSVESDMQYDAINYNDPITVGVAQWYGPRAANVLNRMRTENPTSWTGVASSIASDIANVSSTNTSFWTSRYLTSTEGESLRSVLSANKDIQNSQFSTDIDEYLDRATAWNYNIDTMTEAVAFFCTMYHQSPARSLDVTVAVSWPPTLDAIYQEALANPVLGQYPSRQTKVYNIIKAWDSSGVDGGEHVPTPNPEPDDPGYDVEVEGATLKRMVLAGDNLVAYFGDGTRVLSYPDGKGNWIPVINSVGGGTVHVPGTPSDPEPDPGGVEPGTWTAPTVNARCTNRFGYLSYGWHSGMDLGARSPGVAGDYIKAINNAVVVTKGYHGQVLYLNSGRGLMLDHGIHDGDQIHSYYGHLSDWLVEEGDIVESGQNIARMGGTGANDRNTDFAVHLHIVILVNGNVTNGGMTTTGIPTFADPEVFLKSRGVFSNMNTCPYN